LVTPCGLPAESRTVSTFRPVWALGRPHKLRIRRRGTRLRVSWKRLRGATRQDLLVVKSRGAPGLIEPLARCLRTSKNLVCRKRRH